MNAISRWDPFREMLTMRNAMDRLFEGSFSSAPGWYGPSTWDLALDVAENQDEFVVKASIPGINPDDLEVTYNANVLTIKGEIKSEEESKEGRYHLRERRFGSFTRSISLPSTVKADTIQAAYEAGVLTLRLPKAEEAKPKRIAIQGSGNKMIEGKVVDVQGNGQKN